MRQTRNEKEDEKIVKKKMKLKMRQEESAKEMPKGITLIALVITIIVLLILAGVTIAALSGQNGILSNATKSKEETSYRNAEEKIKLAINGSYDTTGTINEGSYQTEITHLGGSSTIDGTTATTEIDGYTFLVDLSTGEIEQVQTGPVEQP
jgi:type II secretory pathway pseudopilin PulG